MNIISMICTIFFGTCLGVFVGNLIIDRQPIIFFNKTKCVNCGRMFKIDDCSIRVKSKNKRKDLNANGFFCSMDCVEEFVERFEL